MRMVHLIEMIVWYVCHVWIS